MFLSLVYGVQWWGCLYLLHVLCLDLTIFYWPLTYLLNCSCLGLSEYLIVLVGQSFLVHCVVLCWPYCMLGLGNCWGLGLGQWSWLVRPQPVILVLSLIIFFCLGYLSLCSWRSMETMQWSDMYLCVVALVTLPSSCSCAKMRSSVFPSLCVGLCMCCSSLRVAIVLLNMVSSAAVVSIVLILKSPSMIMFLRLGFLSVREG